MPTNDLILTPEERSELQRRVRSRSLRAEDCQRARVILGLASGRGLRETAASLSCSTSYVQRWLGRFRAERLGGLVARHKGRAAAKGAAKLEARILEWTLVQVESHLVQDRGVKVANVMAPHQGFVATQFIGLAVRN